MAEVPLVDLEVIVRYSLAIRQEVAPAEEVLAALDESRALVLSLLEGSGNGNGDDQTDQTDPVDQTEGPAPERGEPSEGGGGRADEEDGDLAEEVAAAEDEVALDDLAMSGADVDGTPGLDPEPAPSRRAPLAAGGTSRRDEVFGPDDEEDQAWVDEVERIRQRRNRKARQEAEERQARQAALAAEARRAKRAEEARRVEAARQAEEEAREEEEARRVQQARRAERGLRAGKPRSGAPARTRAQEARPPRARAADDLEDVLELPPPLDPDEAARRRAERRRRRSKG